MRPAGMQASYFLLFFFLPTLAYNRDTCHLVSTRSFGSCNTFKHRLASEMAKIKKSTRLGEEAMMIIDNDRG